jgi:hypothetical protein
MLESCVFRRGLAAGDPFPILVVGDDEQGLNLPVEKRQRQRFDRRSTCGRIAPGAPATASPPSPRRRRLADAGQAAQVVADESSVKESLLANWMLPLRTQKVLQLRLAPLELCAKARADSSRQCGGRIMGARCASRLLGKGDVICAGNLATMQRPWSMCPESG